MVSTSLLLAIRNESELCFAQIGEPVRIQSAGLDVCTQWSCYP